MDIEDANRKYRIPKKILKEYESWGLCSASMSSAGEYDDSDLERLSVMMTLHDIGFSPSEVETYMRLLENDGSGSARLRMQEKKRETALEDIHLRELKLERLDYLRHELRKEQEGGSV